MEITPSLSAETSANMPQLVKEHLLSIDWDINTYPQELLELSDDEQAISSRVEKWGELIDFSKSEGLPYSVTVARSYTAQGKIEAKLGLEGDVLELTPLAQRVVVLNSIFGSKWNRGNNILMTSQPEVVINTANMLDNILGSKWKRCPQLSVYPVETLVERIAMYDSLLSPQWRNNPVILTQDPNVVAGRAAIYNEWFGSKWHTSPKILTNKPNTVISSARALETVGITIDNTSTTQYFNLLATSVSNKRKKAAYIRQELLGHQQVYIHEDKKSISEIIRARHNQSETDKELETKEVEELNVFLRHLGARGLTYSISSLREWAHAHGYPAKLQL